MGNLIADSLFLFFFLQSFNIVVDIFALDGQLGTCLKFWYFRRFLKFS